MSKKRKPAQAPALFAPESKPILLTPLVQHVREAGQLALRVVDLLSRLNAMPLVLVCPERPHEHPGFSIWHNAVSALSDLHAHPLLRPLPPVDHRNPVQTKGELAEVGCLRLAVRALVNALGMAPLPDGRLWGGAWCGVPVASAQAIGYLRGTGQDVLALADRKPTEKPVPKGKPGRRPYSKELRAYALDLRTNDEDMTAEAIRERCAERFSDGEMPDGPEAFRKWLARLVRDKNGTK